MQAQQAASHGLSLTPAAAVTMLALPSLAAGQPEPLALDERGKPLHVLHQCCVEQRQVDADGADSVVRWAALHEPPRIAGLASQPPEA